jgi:hypothetical protein
VHEALQRRASERPGDSFSGLFGGGSRIGLPYSARNEMGANPMLALEADAQQLSLSPPFPDERGSVRRGAQTPQPLHRRNMSKLEL